jgi:tRNA A37 methylthiotransferase MiaB
MSIHMDMRRQLLAVSFPGLLKKQRLSIQDQNRFSTSHPKDLSDELLHIMAQYHPNICRHIHILPRVEAAGS